MKLMIRAHDLGVKGEKEIINKLHELGLDGIQLVVYKSFDGVSYAEGALTSDRAQMIGDAIKAAGKEVALVGAYFNPVHPNVEKRERGVTVFRDYLSNVRSLGCDTVGSETGSYMGEPWVYHPDNRTEEARERVVHTFRDLADCAATHSACVGIEGAFGHVCYSPDVLADVVKRIDRPNVRVIFDLYNYLDISNYTEAYEILDRGHELFGGDILLYHLKDFTVSDGKLSQCGVGKGILDYERILRSIYNANKDAILMLEGTVGEDIPTAIRHIRDIINKF